jgi:hypothetical protein
MRPLFIRYQPPCFELEPGEPSTALEEAEAIPVKDPQTRIKPLALTSGHGRYMTFTSERTIFL